MRNTKVTSASQQIFLRRAFGYLRVSTIKQAEADLSLPDQKSAIRKYADTNGFNITEYFSDSASGTKSNRSGLTEMIEMALAAIERPSAIIVHSFSRIFRDAFELEALRRKLLKADIALISITQDFGDTEMADITRGIASLMDQYNSAETAKHVRRTMLENANQGYWNGASAPFGYRTVSVEQKGARVKKVLAIDPVEAEVVRTIFNLRVSGTPEMPTMGVKAIVEWLNKNGYSVRGGGPWGISTIHNVLTRTTYIGKHVYNQQNSKLGVRRPEAEHVTVACPRILEDGVFNNVQKLLTVANPKIGRPKSVSGPVLLTELATCSHCGSSMTLATGTGKSGNTYRYYKCAGKIRIGSAKCKGVAIPVAKLDERVMEAVATIVLDPNRVIALLTKLQAKHARESAGQKQRILDLTTRQNDAELRLKNLYDGIAKGILDFSDPTLKNMIDEAKNNRDIATEALKRIQFLSEETSENSEAQIEMFTNALKTALEDGNVHFRKAWLRSLFTKLVVSAEKVEITGSIDALSKAINTTAKNDSGVRAYEPKWCTQRDSNS